MTSAARPTWSAALASGTGLRDGSSSAPTLQTCAKDQPGHLKLKLRQIGQDAPVELRSRDLRKLDTDLITPKRITAVGLVSGDSDVEIEDSSDSDEENNCKNDFIQSKIDESSTDEKLSDLGEDEEDGDNDEDEEEELMRELEKIRRERVAEKALKERKSAEMDPHAVLAGNPLLYTESEISSFGAKRRWDDDVVFKNQAKGIDEKPQKRFINDTTRSDFHRRFMDKFIK